MFTEQNLHSSLAKLGATSPGDIFKQLSDAYGQSTRHYHTAKHVSECLKHFSTYHSDAVHPAEIEVAIWFHDAIYETAKSDNEAQSAQWASRYLLAHAVDAQCVARIAQMIVATKTHQSQTPDSALMVDIDLDVLGADADVFEAYDAAIRREFSWVPTAQYCMARGQVLSSFLAREKIYQTETMHALYESQARENLSRKISELTDKQ